MLTLPLNSEQQYEEWQHILHIAHSNNIPLALLTQLRLRIQRSISQPKSPTPTTSNNGVKLTTFTYSSPQVKKITNIFKHTKKSIDFKCSNTISQLSKPANKTFAPHTLRQMWHLRSNMHDMQQGIRRPNQPEPQAMLQGACSLHQRQQPAVCICCPYCQLPTRLRSHRKNNDPSQAPQEHLLINPYEHCFIQSLQKAGKLISEQSPGEPNPLLQLAINSSHPPT
jgi:hypothetical protein